MTNSQDGQSDWLRRIMIGRNPRRTALRAGLLVVGVLSIAKFVLVPIRVEGTSMDPTYRDGSVNFINRLSFLFREPNRGDVVAIRFTGEHLMLLKRIVAMPGDTVVFHRGRLVVNGRVVQENYVRQPCTWEHEPIEIQPGNYYVVGDNRSMPFADHTQGQAERKRIMGKILL